MRRHWQLVCCAFSFCWYHHAHTPAAEPLIVSVQLAPLTQQNPEDLAGSQSAEKKNYDGNLSLLSFSLRSPSLFPP